MTIIKNRRVPAEVHAGDRRPTGNQTHRRRAGRVAVLSVLATVLSTLAFATAAHADVLERHDPMTYNMQGATDKWSTTVPRLVVGHDIIALQEAGPVPAHDPDGVFQYQNTIHVGAGVIEHYRRNFGTRSRPLERHVYFMRTDPHGHRVNLAMVTTAAPDRFVYVPPSFNNSRPTFGLGFGRTVFFTIHALSGGGNDAPDMVRRIRDYAVHRGVDYAVMGDFNRDPSTWANHLPANGHIYRSGQSTQQSSGELDYMIASRAVQLYEGRRMAGYSSDHYPVDFHVIDIRAGAGPLSIGSYGNHGRSERVLDIAGNSDGNNAHLITFDPHGGANQQFTYVPTFGHTGVIRALSSGKCLDLNKGPNAKRGEWVNQWDCHGQATQLWVPFAWTNDPGAVGFYNQYTDSCLDVLGNKTGNSRWVGIWKCTGTPNQKWTLESR